MKLVDWICGLEIDSVIVICPDTYSSKIISIIVIVFSAGWVMKLELDGDSGADELMNVDAYEQHVKEAV
jgi:hypothetical protein